MLSTVAFDLVQAWRSVRRRPAYAAVAVLTLTLVLGAASALFAVVHATFFRPLPFADGERVVEIYTMPPGVSDPIDRNPLAAVDLMDLRTRTRTLRRIEGFTLLERVMRTSGDPEMVRVAPASAGLFDLLAAKPFIGRAFTAEEEEQHAALAVITDGMWQRMFGRDPRVVGSTIELDGAPYTIVGVMPRGFPPPFLDADILTPLGITARTPPADDARTYVVGLAVLETGATIAQADADIGDAMKDVVAAHPRTRKGWTAGVVSFREWQYGDLETVVLTLLAAMGLVVTLAAANLAGASLAQTLERRGELALRSALGGSAAAVTRLVLTEIVGLSIVGAACGLALAHALLPVLVTLYPAATTPIGAVALHPSVMVVTGLVAIAAAVAAAVPSILHVVHGDSAPAFRTARASAAPGHLRVRRALLAAQAAMCVMLLVGSGLLVRSLARYAALDPGFSRDHVLTAVFRLPESRYGTSALRAGAVQRVLERVRQVPGVVAAGTTQNLFKAGFAYQTIVRIENHPRPDGGGVAAQFRRISPGYFDTMRIPLVGGRRFTDADADGTPLVAIVSRAFAREFWPGEDPIGRRVGRADRWMTVVGIAADVNDVSLTRSAEQTLYVPWAQNNASAAPVGLVLRTKGDPVALAPAIRSAVFQVDERLALDRVKPLDAFATDSLAPERFRTAILAALAGVGLMLGAVGVFGLTSRMVAEGAQEFGVRLALGSQPRALVARILAATLRPIAAGAAAGVAAAIVLARVLDHILPGIGAADTVICGVAVLVLAVTSLAAALWPAVRVLRLDPVRVLRAE